MPQKKKPRVELRFDPEKEGDLLDFIDKNGTTRAGFIKFVIRHYMNAMETRNHQPQSEPTKSEPIKEIQKEKTKSQATRKKQLPKLGNSFSTKDFED